MNKDLIYRDCNSVIMDQAFTLFHMTERLNNGVYLIINKFI